MLAPTSGDEGAVDFDYMGPIGFEGRPPWHAYAEKITSAEVQGVVRITGKLCRLFDGCSMMESVDVSGLDTSKVKDFQYMFAHCEGLTFVDLSMLDVSSATRMLSMFYNCQKLAEVKLPDFSNAKLTGIGNMFCGCKSLKSIDISSIDISELRIASLAFGYCYSLEKIIVGDKWSLIEAAESKSGGDASFTSMFPSCRSLVGANGTTYDDALDRDDWKYAQIDTPDTPGYLWPADDSENVGGKDGNGDSGGGDGGGSGDSGGNQGRDADDNSAGNGAGGGIGGGDSGGGNADPGDNSKGGDSADDSGSGGSDANAGAGKDAPKGTNQNAAGGSSASGDKLAAGAATTPSSVKTDAKTSSSTAARTSGVKAKSVIRSLAKASVKRSQATFAYNGKARTPAVTVSLQGKKLKAGRDFTVKYPKGRKAIGTYKLVIAGKGLYNSKVEASFKIVPKAPRLKSLKAHKNRNGSSGFITAWSKSAKNGVGYQVRWSPDKTFKSSASYTFESASSYAAKASAALQVRMRAWLGKTAYVQVRAFKNAGGTTYWSSWSPAKAVKLKK